MTRIVGGTAGGRRIEVPSGEATRPTSDRAREGLFNTLDGLLEIARIAVLDLYAGSGALGLEALSRGASIAIFVESSRRAAAAISANLAALGMTGEIRREPAKTALRRPPARPVRLVLADPPYAVTAGELSAVLTQLLDGWLDDDAVLVVERSARDPEWTWPAGIKALKSRTYGEAALWYGRRP
ncbi:MAG: 16S rRNA (guanine(966)-N(2))-methyltransferase RsmD [Mycobacteriales bacterium]